MKTNLIVTDPLAGQEVSIMVTVAVCEDGEVCLPRDERPSLISVGVAGQMPITRSGTFGDMQDLIHEAWTAFGVREQVNEQAATLPQSSTGVTEELIAEATVATTDDTDTLPPTVSVTKPVPKPPVSKLSLF